MDVSARDTYFETQVATATPQRLRLMLIEGALRQARVAQGAWRSGDVPAGLQAITHCRDIVSELIAGIQPEQTPVAKQVLGIYMFLFSTLVEAQFARDSDRLSDIIRVLEEERQTWQAVCEQMPDRPIAAAASTEELAPQRVSDAWTPGYGLAPPHSRKQTSSAFSIDA
jgi:flagellar protein FliS